MMYVLALSPVLLLVLLLLVFRLPLFKAGFLAFLYASLIAFTHWFIIDSYFVASVVKAFFISFDILLIISGAILFLEYLKSTGLIKGIEDKLLFVSDDKKIQAVVIVWFFGAFIEGIAGFGTPAAVTAPLLVALGFPAVLSVVLALIGNSVAVVFGAVGTPFIVGFSGLDVSFVAPSAAFINLFAGLSVPLLIIWTINRFEGSSLRNFYRYVPFGLFAGLCFLVPYFLFSFVGPEFPSLIGSMFGLVVLLFCLKKNIFVPKGHVSKKFNFSFFEFVSSFFPYILLVSLLLISKFLPSFVLQIAEGVSHSFSLSNPGIVFFVSVALLSFFKKRFVFFGSSLRKVFGLLLRPFLAIFFVSGIVQVLILSSYNETGSLGMLQLVSELFVGNYYLFVVPVLGVFGSFLSGSATVSNILFGAFHLEVIQSLGFSAFIVLALQVVGAGVGNMISLTNIVAAQSTVGLKNKEMVILGKTLLPALIYLLFVIIVGFLFSLFFGVFF